MGVCVWQGVVAAGVSLCVGWLCGGDHCEGLAAKALVGVSVGVAEEIAGVVALGGKCSEGQQPHWAKGKEVGEHWAHYLIHPRPLRGRGNPRSGSGLATKLRTVSGRELQN